MKEHNLKDLGTLVHLFMKGNHPNTAQVFLNEMQARIDAAIATEPNDILVELPMVETSEPKLEHKPELSEAPATSIAAALIATENLSPERESEHKGLPRDAQGNITRISVLAGDPGYDPDVHENKELKILCDGVHILTAHTADTIEGFVLYYEKNEKGRIKTLEKRGKVEIKGLK